MTLADPITLASKTSGNVDLDDRVMPVQLASCWTDVIAATGLSATPAQGNATNITNPGSSIASSTTQLVSVDGRGTTLRVRMAYDAATTNTVTDPIIQVFGRCKNSGNSDTWKRLLNKNATPAFSVTLTTAPATDVSTGTFKFTEASLTDHAFDLDGCDELLFGVHTAYAGSNGDETLAKLQAKVI